MKKPKNTLELSTVLLNESEVIVIDTMLDFKGEVEKYKKINNLTNKDIAEATGYAKTTIDKFMDFSNRTKSSAKVAFAISKALKIPLEVT